MRKLILYVILEDVLVLTLSGKNFPQGLWDFKINWKIWNWIISQSPEQVWILSNQGGSIARGTVTTSGAHAKVSFLRECLKEKLGPKVKVGSMISYVDPWKSYLGDTGTFIEIIRKQNTVSAKNSEIKELFIGRDIDFDRDYAKSFGIDYKTPKNINNEK